MKKQKTVMVVGTEDDVQSMYMKKKLEAKGVYAPLFDTLKYPTQILTTYSDNSPIDGYFQENKQSPKIPLEDIISVYRRWSKGVKAPKEEDPLLAEVVYWNIESAVGTFFRCLDCLWVNKQEATDLHKYKGYQLKLLQKSGIRIPETIFTNDPDEFIHFCETIKTEVIFKPVRGWAHTEKVTPELLNKETLATLANSPVTLQECIDGTDLRIYVIKDEIFAMEIQTDALDFREDKQAKRVPIKLPTDVEEDCYTIAKLLDYTFTGIDMRRTPQGEYVVFEGNPTPVFMYDEETSGYPISDKLIDVLLKGK